EPDPGAPASDAAPGAAPGASPTGQAAGESQPDPCADPTVAARVDEGLASDTEGAHNSILVSPEEMTELGHSDAEAANQLAEWERLSREDVAFQQCLRARQGEPTLDPVQGGERPAISSTIPDGSEGESN
ncbi:hypothetical protein, partial [Actinotalea sp. C106]|uniref:hypothetical protein n=1 Tax=Actinotalea sp. C106 TaxID=2908644 RepID=UPI0020280ABA